MSAEEKKVAESLVQAFEMLPDNKKEYLLGYAEGVAAMAEQQKAKTAAEKLLGQGEE